MESRKPPQGGDRARAFCPGRHSCSPFFRLRFPALQTPQLSEMGAPLRGHPRPTSAPPSSCAAPPRFTGHIPAVRDFQSRRRSRGHAGAGTTSRCPCAGLPGGVTRGPAANPRRGVGHLEVGAAGIQGSAGLDPWALVAEGAPCHCGLRAPSPFLPLWAPPLGIGRYRALQPLEEAAAKRAGRWTGLQERWRAASSGEAHGAHLPWPHLGGSLALASSSPAQAPFRGWFRGAHPFPWAASGSRPPLPTPPEALLGGEECGASARCRGGDPVLGAAAPSRVPSLFPGSVLPRTGTARPRAAELRSHTEAAEGKDSAPAAALGCEPGGRRSRARERTPRCAPDALTPRGQAWHVAPPGTASDKRRRVRALEGALGITRAQRPVAHRAAAAL